MISFALLTLAALWMVVLHRYPAMFIFRKPTGLTSNPAHLGENWIEVQPSHREFASMQEVG